MHPFLNPAAESNPEAERTAYNEWLNDCKYSCTAVGMQRQPSADNTTGTQA